MEDKVCHLCDKSFTRAWNLKQHLAMGNCAKEKKYCCSDCKHYYTDKKAFNRHVCRAQVEKALITARREGIQMGKPDAKGKVPSNREISYVMDLLDNKYWYTSKAILTIAKGSLWYEKAADYDDDQNDKDSISDPSEEGGDTDFEDEDERSILASQSGDNGREFEDQEPEEEQNQEEVYDDEESDHCKDESDESSTNSEDDSDDRDDYGRKLPKDKRTAINDEKLRKIHAINEAARQEKMNAGKPKPIPLGFPNDISATASSVRAVGSVRPILQKPASAMHQPLSIIRSPPGIQEARTDSNIQNTSKLEQKLEQKQEQKLEPKKVYPHNIIMQSKKEKHYYESDHSEEERGYIVPSNSDNPDECEEYILTKEELRMKKDGWIPTFEDKGKTLKQLVVILNNRVEQEKQDGKFLVHPILQKMANNDNSSGNDGPASKSGLELPLIMDGHYLHTIHVLLGHSDMYDTLLHIVNISATADYLEADFRLVKKLYLNGRKKSEIPIKVTDLRRYKIEYLDENKIWISDTKGLKLSKILCDNLLNTYLRVNAGLGYIIKEFRKDQQQDKEELMDKYQMNKTQGHIQKLSDSKIQAKLGKRLIEFIGCLGEQEVVK